MKFARQEKRSHEPLDINRVVEDSVAIVNHQLTINRVKIKKQITSSIPEITGNGNQFQQVLLNLMINAQQAFDGKPGEVTIGTRVPDPDHVEIFVRDNGPGIPEDVQKKVFEPFFTTKPAGKGTGLGLSVTYGIIKDNGGEIEVKSNFGEGATFIITLPTAEKRELAASRSMHKSAK